MAGATGGEAVNAGIDNLKATGERLLELPLVVLLAAVAALAALVQLAVALGSRAQEPRRLPRLLGVSAAVVALFAIAWLADRRIGRLQDELLRLYGERAGALAAAQSAVPASA